MDTLQEPPERASDTAATGNLFESFFVAAALGCSERKDRASGAAFLKAACELHELTTLEYAAFNVAAPGGRGLYSHCHYTDRFIRHAIGAHFEVPPMGALIPDDVCLVHLRTTSGETAYLAACFTSGSGGERPLAELRTLGNYFHAHICRINGNSFVQQDLTERELDCLQWTAAGKTAWEAGVILGLTERTVRFHLNLAREKLECATTAQAVAKAVGRGIISA